MGAHVLKRQATRAVEMAKAGESVKSIARACDYTEAGIRAILKRVGVKEPQSEMARTTQQAVALAVSGSTIKEIAEAIGYTYVGASVLLRRAGVSARRAGKGLRDEARAEKMAAMFKQGITLEKIGLTFGLSRERVRQILAKAGLTGSAGGMSVAAESKREARALRINAAALMRFGVSWAKVKECRANGLLVSFTRQRNTAKQRAVDWSLTFGQWLAIWEQSGKLAQRGRGKGQYVMSRIKDTGGYEVGNVHIQTCNENSREAVSKWRGKTKANRGVFHLYPGMARPWLAKGGGKSLGYFATEAEAVAARAAYLAQVQPAQAPQCGEMAGNPGFADRLIHAADSSARL